MVKIDSISTSSSQNPTTCSTTLSLIIIPVSPFLLPGLRQSVLHPTVSLESQLFPYDHEPTTIHLGAFLVSSSSLSISAFPSLPSSSSLLPSTSPSPSSPSPSPALLSPSPLSISPFLSSSSSFPLSTSSGSDSSNLSTSSESDSSKLVGSLTLVQSTYPRPLDTLPLDIQAKLARTTRHVQLRKFAVSDSYQGKGIGRALMNAAVKLVTPTPTLFFFNARLDKSGFYKKMGMEILHDEIWIQQSPVHDGRAVECIHMGTVLGYEE
ncbi:hypothetical protein BCR39DRAFT_121420 [Naematelia encephala]|uniref:N-acetyltransferase domain-containing protein n=1 Tax=Naematelia encephala TaxID=71784 RepID=A0A1Y2BIT3_9TREE|nr:hypothetical protein BCR39DRAFT_121420 [Naematelia encephala]